MFTVDKIIADNLPSIDKRPYLKSPVKAALQYLLHEKEFQEFADKYPHLQGIEFTEQVLEYMDFSFSVRDNEKVRIPAEGPVVIIANHPIGSLDALALIKLISEVRSDIKVVANELLMAIKPLHCMLLPVNNMKGGTPKDNLRRINEHLENEGAIIIFPAGEVSRVRPNGIRDTRWHTGFLRMAMAAQAPILPVFLDAKNSPVFYGVSMLYKPLATFLLVKELFNKRNKHLPARIGELIPYSSYSDLQLERKQLARLFKRHIYKLSKKHQPVFATEAAIAHPEPRAELKKAIYQCELLGKTQDGKEIFLYKVDGSSPIMREIGRLREIAFRAVGEGTGTRRDIDKFDSYYFHLILWDKDDLEIVGAYRLGDTKKIIEEKGIEALYTETLFEYGDQMGSYFSEGLELGRSFVQPRYWGNRSLDYLWYGIGAFLHKNPGYRYLFGAVSISNEMPTMAKQLLVYFYQLYFSNEQQIAKHRAPYAFSEDIQKTLQSNFAGNNYKEDFKELKSLLANMGTSVPTLYKQYTELCEPGGVSFLDFGVDEDFNDCIDGLVLVDITKLKPKKMARYIDASNFSD